MNNISINWPWAELIQLSTGEIIQSIFCIYEHGFCYWYFAAIRMLQAITRGNVWKTSAFYSYLRFMRKNKISNVYLAIPYFIGKRNTTNQDVYHIKTPWKKVNCTYTRKFAFYTKLCIFEPVFTIPVYNQYSKTHNISEKNLNECIIILKCLNTKVMLTSVQFYVRKLRKCKI